MKWFLAVLVVVLLALQYRLWVGEGSIAHVTRLKQQIAEQDRENQRLRMQNERLAVEVKALKNGYDVIEARAREELGFVKKDETFFLFIEKENAQPSEPSP